MARTRWAASRFWSFAARSKASRPAALERGSQIARDQLDKGCGAVRHAVTFDSVVVVLSGRALESSVRVASPATWRMR